MAEDCFVSGPLDLRPLLASGADHCLLSESPTSPSVFPLSVCSAESDTEVVIGCLVQGFFPSEPLNVTWSYSGEDTIVTNYPPAQDASGVLYTTVSQLTLPAAQCPDSESVTCHVEHNSDSSQDVIVPCKASACDNCTNPCGSPRLSLHRPALEDLLLGSDANLTCTLSGLKDPEGVYFTWEPSEGAAAVQQPYKLDACGCYSVSSILPGCAEPWNLGQTFTCTGTYPASSTTLTATIAKASEDTYQPQVHLLPPPSEELALNELVTLTCLARGFSPKDVLVRWLHGTEELPREDYLTWAPKQEPSQGATTFAVASLLRVTAEVWRNGDNFSCVVGHETLPKAFTQKTIDRLAGKPNQVNVSVVLSEVDGICY